MRRRLERIEIPGEHEARERTWATLEAAFGDRAPEPRRRRLLPAVAVAAVAFAVGAAALSPPGRAVIDSVRKAIGVETPDATLVSLRGGGRLLVASGTGAWIVHADGTRRRLGSYRQPTWSPRGLFVGATGTGESGSRELVALDPVGEVRWKLARSAHLRFPTWAPSGFRIAYLTGSSLRVVAGDGTDDRLLVREVAPTPPAWRPGPRHVLAYAASDGSVVVLDADANRKLWSVDAVASPRALVWSPDGRRLLVLGRHARAIVADGRILRRGGRALAAAWGPRLALLRRAGGRSELVVGGRRLFSGTGTFTDLAWSPNGRWIILAWREPDQWLFVETGGSRRVRAIANVSRQFESEAFPTIAGWCCP